MTEKERLVELLIAKEAVKDTNAYDRAESLADYLIEHGVIVPPCKIGQTVWWIAGCFVNYPQLVEVTRIQYTAEHGFDMSGFTRNQTCRLFNEKDIGDIVFLTREEAEKALAERSSNGKDT